MTGRTGGRASGGIHSIRPDQQPAASTKLAALKLRPSARLHPPGGALPIGRGDLRPGVNGDVLSLQRRQQRRGHTPGVDAGLTGNARSASDGGGEPGLELAAGAARQPFRGEPKAPVELVAAPQLLGLVAVQRHVKGTAIREAHLDPGVLLQLDRRSPASAAVTRRLKPSRRSSPQEASPDRRQHAGGDPGRARGRMVALEHADARAAPGGPPGAGQPDHAAADEDRVVSVVCLASAHRARLIGRGAPTSLRRHYPDQVQTVGGASAALSARWWAPVAQPSYPLIYAPPWSERRARPDPSCAPRGNRRAASAAAAVGSALLRLRRPSRTRTIRSRC